MVFKFTKGIQWKESLAPQILSSTASLPESDLSSCVSLQKCSLCKYLFSSSFVTQKGTYYTNIALYLRLFCISTFGTFRSISFLSTALGFSIMWLNHSLFNNLLMRDIKCVASQYTMLIWILLPWKSASITYSRYSRWNFCTPRREFKQGNGMNK